MKLIRLFWIYWTDFIKANFIIAKQLLSPKMDIDPVVVEIPTSVSSPLEVLAISNLVTFTPGTLTMDIEPGKSITIHALDRDSISPELFRERLEDPLLAVTRKS